MNVQDFTYLLQNPDQVIATEQTNQLEDVIEEYPYFQAARALHLKGLKNGNSFKYNNALKITAAYTADRDVLFDFITSEEFLQNSIADTIVGNKDEPPAKEIIPDKEEYNEGRPKELIVVSEDKPLPQSTEDADQILDPTLFKSKDPKVDKQIEAENAAKTLELGQPLSFTKNEKHSFSEWLQLASLKKIDRSSDALTGAKEENESNPDLTSEEEILKKRNFELIDKFLEENPKIVPQATNTSEIDIAPSVTLNKNELMTATLAKVYLEQKKYKKAIQAYRILSLKYPEKSGFFADRIRAIEKIQKENTSA